LEVANVIVTGQLLQEMCWWILKELQELLPRQLQVGSMGLLQHSALVEVAADYALRIQVQVLLQPPLTCWHQHGCRAKALTLKCLETDQPGPASLVSPT
jgi:hypothetical protein